MSTPEMIWRPTGIGSARLVVAVVVALVATFIGPTAATASTLTAVAEVVVVDVGDVGALPYSYDHRADFARPPPVEDASRHYDTAKPVNLVEALGRARRLFSVSMRTGSPQTRQLWGRRSGGPLSWRQVDRPGPLLA